MKPDFKPTFIRRTVRKAFLLSFPAISIYKMESLFMMQIVHIPALLLGSWFLISYYYYFWSDVPKRKPQKIYRGEHHAHISMWVLFVSALLSQPITGYYNVEPSILEIWMLIWMAIGGHVMYSLVKYQHEKNH